MGDEGRIDRDEVLQGFLYDHTRINLNTIETHGALASVEALVEVLVARGLVEREEYEARRAEASERLRGTFVEKGMAVAILEHGASKYAIEDAVEVDCANRLHLCGAACCRLPFALSKEDVEEGVLRWDLGHPYFIARAPSGSCFHLDPEARTCGVYGHRPIPCRKYSCARDKRIWQDFAARIPNPSFQDPDWPASFGTAAVGADE